MMVRGAFVKVCHKWRDDWLNMMNAQIVFDFRCLLVEIVCVKVQPNA